MIETLTQLNSHELQLVVGSLGLAAVGLWGWLVKAGFQTDAPSCDGCGSITVRNGNCYLCHNCGNSMGCS